MHASERGEIATPARKGSPRPCHNTHTPPPGARPRPRPRPHPVSHGTSPLPPGHEHGQRLCLAGADEPTSQRVSSWMHELQRRRACRALHLAGAYVQCGKRTCLFFHSVLAWPGLGGPGRADATRRDAAGGGEMQALVAVVRNARTHVLMTQRAARRVLTPCHVTSRHATGPPAHV